MDKQIILMWATPQSKHNCEVYYNAKYFKKYIGDDLSDLIKDFNDCYTGEWSLDLNQVKDKKWIQTLAEGEYDNVNELLNYINENFDYLVELLGEEKFDYRLSIDAPDSHTFYDYLDEESWYKIYNFNTIDELKTIMENDVVEFLKKYLNSTHDFGNFVFYVKSFIEDDLLQQATYIGNIEDIERRTQIVSNQIINIMHNNWENE